MKLAMILLAMMLASSCLVLKVTMNVPGGTYVTRLTIFE